MSDDLIANLNAFVRHLEMNKPAILRHPNFIRYITDFETYIRLPGAESRVNFWPCLDDKINETPLDKYYFYQDTWAAKKVFKIRPDSVVNVCSTALLAGIISQFVPTTSIDIRPLPVRLEGLSCKQGSITNLPFKNASVEFLTSMCVIEHIGLARYGDEPDPMGSIDAFMEVSRVMRPGGHFIFSVPLSHTPGLLFNAHRIFSKEQVLGLLGPTFRLEDELFLFPEPGDESQVARLKDFQYCVWCAHAIKKQPSLIFVRSDDTGGATAKSQDNGIQSRPAGDEKVIKKETQPHINDKKFSFSKLFLDLYKAYGHELADLRDIERHRYDQTIFPTTGQYDLFESQILYMLVRCIAPANMVEFSSSSGYSTIFTATAMKRNERGTLHTFEIDTDSWQATKRNVERFGLNNHTKCIKGDVTKCLEQYIKGLNPKPEILFIDSDHSGPFAEWYFENIFPLLPAGAFVHIHDILPKDHETRILHPPAGSVKAALSGENEEVFRFLDSHGYRHDTDYIYLYTLSHKDTDWVSKAQLAYPGFRPYRMGKERVIRRMNNNGEFAEWNATLWLRLKGQ